MSERTITLPGSLYKQVAEEFGIDERAVKYMYDSYISEIIDIANYTDATSIRLPHIGVLYVNKKFVESEIAYLTKSGTDDKKLEAYKAKKEIIDKEIRDYGNKPALKKRCLHVKRARIANPYFTSGKTLKEIEDIQNARIQKHSGAV